MKREIRVFFTALMFYTRIPCPAWVDHTEELLNSASRYLPLIGLIVGGIGAGVFAAAQLVLPLSVSVILSMAATIWITGAFHEDGFGDLCDGLGGGWTVEQRLDIMKDSRMGAFGVIGIVLILSVKFAALVELEPRHILIALPISHALSRFAPIIIMATLSYVRLDEKSKVKPIAKKIGIRSFFFAATTALVPLLLPGLNEALYRVLYLIGAFAVALLIMRYFLKTRLSGYTGDGLGATQQLTEACIYLSLTLPAFSLI